MEIPKPVTYVRGAE